VRTRSGDNLGAIAVPLLIERLKAEIAARTA
jgi:hypothetical protein